MKEKKQGSVEDARVELNLSVEQAAVIQRSLELFSRIGMGQLEEIAYLDRIGLIARKNPDAGDQENERLDEAMEKGRAALGYQRGEYKGIASRDIPKSVAMAFEIFKTLSKPLAIHNNPEPGFLTTDYDGLIFRITDVEPPKVKITTKQGRVIESDTAR